MPNVLLISAMQGTQQAQLLAVAGFVMLGWVLARRQLKMRKRVNRDSRAANKELQKLRAYKEPQLPLADAPAETQRWQVALFDLQRELKAELDTRIVIVQTLMRQLDSRIARLDALSGDALSGDALSGDALAREGLAGDHAAPNSHSLEATVPRQSPLVGEQAAQIEKLVLGGFTAGEIASKLDLPIGDVELSIATMRVG